MRIKGVHYDIGMATTQGSTTRPTLPRAQIEDEIRDIRTGLGATAIRITGGDLGRIATAAEIASTFGLEVWLSPIFPNANKADTLAHIVEAAKLAEGLQTRGARAVMVVGCELSVFMSGILPGENHVDRLMLLTDPTRLMAAVQASAIDPQAEMTEFLHTANEMTRSLFQGPVTYASGIWEEVDWSDFDFVGVDAYRDASNREEYPEMLRKLTEHGPPLVLTEVGCATYKGASDAGGLAWTATVSSSHGTVLREGIERQESEQGRELSQLLKIAEENGVEGVFVFTYISPNYPTSQDPHHDLDAASFALMRSWPDGRTEKKAGYDAVAEAFAGSE
jgi:hypothetical protein